MRTHVALGASALLLVGGAFGIAGRTMPAEANPSAVKVVPEASASRRLPEVSRPFVPDSVAQMSKASELIVVGTPVEESRVEVIHGVPFTLRDVVVETRVKGPEVARVTVRELGDGSLGTSLVPGQKVVLFLVPFEFERGKATGQWAITGLFSGVYRVVDGTAYRMDPEAPGLPARIAVGDLVRSAESQP
ncbi:hypothetical protein [Mobilicoccus sp.]|uniref:hypothetical protein n=1 Tax=Mobilicoccus sp. TaxID=2034349 RepID=UPI0028A90490|nr:hypothetical protein [Mobilicoccus sp.]